MLVNKAPIVFHYVKGGFCCKALPSFFVTSKMLSHSKVYQIFLWHQKGLLQILSFFWGVEAVVLTKFY
jgi:hypothetical protein